MIVMKPLALTLLALTTVRFAFATDYLFAPNDRQTSGGGVGFFGPLANAPRTYQLIINANQLTGFVGRNLNGFTFRQISTSTAAWPSAPVTYGNYDIYLSSSVAPSARSLTFAANIVGSQLQVRSGPLTISSHSFPILGTNFSFGTDIAFSNYLYLGGNLLIEIRHTGSGGTNTAVDSVASSGGTGYGSQVSACWQSGYTATSGSPGNFAVTRLRALDVPTWPISGTLHLLDFLGNPLGRDFALKLTNAGSTITVFSSTVGLTASSGYTLNIPATTPLGSYDLYANGTTFLRRKIMFTLAAGGVSGVDFNLPNGDVENSGEVDATDIDIVIAGFGNLGQSPPDVDGSEEVDAADIDIVISNFGGVDE